MPTIVVAGAQKYGAGKTRLIIGLARELASLGISVGASKPVSVTSLWYDHAVIEAVLREGVLTDKDTLAFRKLSLTGPVTLSNPINVVTAVPDPIRYGDIRTYLDDLDSLFSLPLLARVTFGGVTRYFRMHDFEGKVSEQEVSTVDELVDGIGVKPRDVSTSWFYSYIASKEVGAGIAESVLSLSRERDIHFVESVSTALLPATTLANIVDALIIVLPGRAMVYSGEHVRAYIRGVTGPGMLDVRQFMRFIKPVLTAPLARRVGEALIRPHRRLVKALASLARK